MEERGHQLLCLFGRVFHLKCIEYNVGLTGGIAATKWSGRRGGLETVDRDRGGGNEGRPGGD